MLARGFRTGCIVFSILVLVHLALIAPGWAGEAEETLRNAVRDGDGDRVQTLLGETADLSLPDEEGNTLLHVAAARGHDSVATLLVEKGVAIDSRNEKGETPLHLAAGMGDYETVRLLVEHGADVTVAGNAGWTPLHQAAELRNLEMAQMQKAFGLESTYNWKRDNEQVAEFLIEHGADVNAQNKFGDTPLHRTTPWNNLPVTMILVQHGADLNIKNKDGLTPLAEAKRKRARDVAKYLKKQLKGKKAATG
jgi:cytohesin